MKYAVIEADIFRPFDTQEQCKAWIKENHAVASYRLIEFQDIATQIETTVTFKRPAATRAS